MSGQLDLAVPEGFTPSLWRLISAAASEYWATEP